MAENLAHRGSHAGGDPFGAGLLQTDAGLIIIVLIDTSTFKVLQAIYCNHAFPVEAGRSHASAPPVLRFRTQN